MIALLKETSIIGWVGSTPGSLTFDLNAAAGTIYRTIPNYLASGIIIGCCYLVIVYAMVFGIKYIEKRLKKNER
jgi:ABC-type amino acid transport system permease subunit